VISFLTSLAVHAGLFLLMAAPVLVLTWRRGGVGARDTIRRFLVAAAVGAVFCALVALSGQRLTAQCTEQGYSRCADVGGDGFRWAVIIAYAVGVVLKVRSMRRR
jgi:hypothetical protein